MERKSIDLLKPEEISLAEKKRTFFLKAGAIFLIVLYCLVVVGIFSFGLVVSREAQEVADKVKFKQERLNELQQIESLQFLLKQRLSSLAKVVAVDGIKPKYWLNYLDSLVPEGVALESVQWNSSGEVTLAGIAGNALGLADFLDNLKKATDEEKIASSTLVSATRQTEGVYSFNLEILVKE